MGRAEGEWKESLYVALSLLQKMALAWNLNHEQNITNRVWRV